MLSLLALALLPCALAAPAPATDGLPIHVPLVRRSVTPQERVARLPQIVDSIRLKYGYQPVNPRKKRSTASASITDEQNDSSYSAVVSVGTPAQVFNLILDTGSSDLWVATGQCDSCSSDTPLFDTTASTSYKNESSFLQISYGSGEVGGYVSQDTVNFMDLTMTQELLSVTDTSSGLLSDPLSGIMGLGWQSISALNATPFWESLFNQNKLSSPVFGFYLERWVNQVAVNTAPGGTFTIGGTNTSAYSGNIEFINMPSGTIPGYWLQQVSSLKIQGKSVSVSSSDGLAAIDTGTTLIGAPSSLVKQIWDNVSGSVALSGSNQGMYAYPCSTSLSVTISFGGTDWPISDADMNFGSISGSGSSEMCIGAIFDVGNSVGGSGQGVPSWIVGDTFLKNVYSVFQADPPAVGFAQLASNLSGNTTSGSNPYGSGASGSPFPSGSSSDALRGNRVSPGVMLSISLGVAVPLFSWFFIAF